MLLFPKKNAIEQGCSNFVLMNQISSPENYGRKKDSQKY